MYSYYFITLSLVRVVYSPLKHHTLLYCCSQVKRHKMTVVLRSLHGVDVTINVWVDPTSNDVDLVPNIVNKFTALIGKHVQFNDVKITGYKSKATNGKIFHEGNANIGDISFEPYNTRGNPKFIGDTPYVSQSVRVHGCSTHHHVYTQPLRLT